MRMWLKPTLEATIGGDSEFRMEEESVAGASFLSI